MDVIFKYKTTKRKQLNAILLFDGLISVFILIGYGIKIALIVFILILLMSIVFEFFYKSFNGWDLGNEFITLLSYNLIGPSRKVKIKFSDINQVIYHASKGARDPSYMEIQTTFRNYKLYSIPNIFKLAPTLKHLKWVKKIPVNLDFFDHEIDLFLNDKIKKIPMSNDDKIYE